MSPDVHQLATRLRDAFDQASCDDTHGLSGPLLRLLALGEPVSAEALAAAAGRPVEHVRRVLPTRPSIELDDEGRVVGSGISLRPTPHRFVVNHRQLYTWCALDTLIFPKILGEAAQVHSPCHVTGQPVILTVRPDHIEDLEPATAVVSVITPDDVSDVRAAFCSQVHFFANAEAAQPWREQHPDITVLPVAEAFALASQLTAGHFDEPASPAAPEAIHDHGE